MLFCLPHHHKFQMSYFMPSMGSLVRATRILSHSNVVGENISLAMIQVWIIEYIISSFYKNSTSKILLSYCGGKCAILWLLSWPIPVFRLLWDFPRFSCEITWLLPTPLLAINKMFEVFASLSSTEGAFQNRPFKIYKSAFFWEITGAETYWDTSETQLNSLALGYLALEHN